MMGNQAGKLNFFVIMVIFILVKEKEINDNFFKIKIKII